MALRKILTDGDPALHKMCRPVTSFDARLHTLQIGRASCRERV